MSESNHRVEEMLDKIAPPEGCGDADVAAENRQNRKNHQRNGH